MFEKIGSVPDLDIGHIFNALPGSYLVLTPDLIVVAITDELLVATLTQRDKIVGRYVFDALPDDPENPAGFQVWKNSLEKVLRTRKPDVMPLVKYSVRSVAAGSSFTTKYWEPSNFPILAHDGLVKYIVHKTEEVTELQRAQARVKFAVEAAGMGEWEIDVATGETFRSAKHDHCFGYVTAQPEWKLEDALRHVHPEDRMQVESAHLAALAGIRDLNFDCRVIWPDQSLHWITARARIERDVSGTPVRLTGLVWDITDVKRTQEQLKTSVRVRDEFLSIASHELKTPVTSLRMQLQMTQRKVIPEKNLAPPPLELSKTLTLATRQIERLSVLIEDLLDVSRLETGKMRYNFETVEITTLVAEVVERFAEQLDKVRCTCHTMICGPFTIICDRTRIEQVVTNLLTNAIKYGAGSQINVRVTGRGARGAMIEVSDDGIGIAADNQTKIFERFERIVSSRIIGGLGLGLYITKQIIGAHKGSITLKSDLGEGSTFTVWLPETQASSTTEA